MKKYLLAAITAVFVVAALFLAFRLILPFFTPKDGYLQISTSVPTQVSLDDQDVGKSPYRGEKLPTGIHKLTLSAQFSTASSKIAGGKKVSWTGNVSLFSNVLSVVNFDFGPSSDFNASEILTLRKGSTSISIATQPENVKVDLDGTSLGTAPVNKEIKSGVHRLRFSKENYIDRQIDINVQDSFQTVVQVDLALNPLVKASSKLDTKNGSSLYDLSVSEAKLYDKSEQWALGVWFFQEKATSLETKFDALIDIKGKAYYYDEASFNAKIKAGNSTNVGYLGKKSDIGLSSEAKKTWEGLFPSVKVSQIQVLSTPTGTLNVRESPNQTSKILTTIKPGEKYDLLVEQTGWYKIKVGSTQGWVSSQYAKKI